MRRAGIAVNAGLDWFRERCVGGQGPARHPRRAAARFVEGAVLSTAGGRVGAALRAQPVGVSIPSRELGQLVEMKLVDRYIHQDKRTYFCALSPRGRQVLPLLPRDVSAAAPVRSQGRVARRDAATLDGPAAAL